MSKYFWHSIGTERPINQPSQHSWKFRRDAAIITAGFHDQPEKGRRVLQRYKVGDIIFLYANGYGVVAAAEITDDQPYHAQRDPSEPGNLPNHLHRRKVRWLCAAQELSDAVGIHDFEAQYGLYHPIQTSQEISNVSGAEGLLEHMQQKFGILHSYPSA